MSQMQSSGCNALDALRIAATAGEASVLRDVTAEALLSQEEHALPQLLLLCDSNTTEHNLVLLNASWKLLLSVASLRIVSTHIYSKILHFMFSQLQYHIFSHDWSEGKKIKLAAFIASHVVSATRAHPSYAVRDVKLVSMIIELHTTVCLTIATSERTEAAQQLHQIIGLRLIAILEAIGSACEDQQPLSAEEHLQLMLQSLAAPPTEAMAALTKGSVAAGSSVAALTTMLAVTRSPHLLSDAAYVEMLLSAALLWLPHMRLVLFDADEGELTTTTTTTTTIAITKPTPPPPPPPAAAAAATLSTSVCDDEPGALLYRRVLQHAKSLPRSVFSTDYDKGGITDSSGEIGLDMQLLLLMQRLACRSIDTTQYRNYQNEEGTSSNQGLLLRFRVFPLLLAALLVPNDASAARVLLVWGSVLNHLSDTDRESLGIELLLLGEDQLRALRELPSTISNSRITYLRRFINALAVLLAEICRLLERSPKDLAAMSIQGRKNTTIGTFSSSLSSVRHFSFCCMCDCLYYHTRTYQWWNEEITMGGAVGGTSSVDSEIITFQEEVKSVLAEWQHVSTIPDNNNIHIHERLQAIIISIPGKIRNIVERSASSGSITAALLVVTRVLQTIVEDVSTESSQKLCVCARFVASELIALMGSVLSEDSTFLACLRRLIDISFNTEINNRENEEREGMQYYHAAVCLRQFAERNTAVPLGKLHLSESVSTALMTLLQETTVSAAADPDSTVNIRVCEELLEQQAEEWQSLVSHYSQEGSSITLGSLFDMAPQDISSQSGTENQEGRFLSSLQRCEDTLRLLLHWQESGCTLHPSEEEALGRLEQLVSAAVNIAHPTICSSSNISKNNNNNNNSNNNIIIKNEEVVRLSEEVTIQEKDPSETGPEIIHVD
ncbi:uncharacterized protein TM35_000231170 [Trypanosoma theileri]|uniref:Uncharacterized protein n=1 Tax=Trypanosoma theileri TaxID=67003 RepID=A0A1X0NR01_9TRYP|nr:uncharacterized protein TM35_000231170 [Trypanosoma theileri]ORC87146.1 hypothetical protein TM35_000231170 [Trypanosoma theileri]